MPCTGVSSRRLLLSTVCSVMSHGVASHGMCRTRRITIGVRSLCAFLVCRKGVLKGRAQLCGSFRHCSGEGVQVGLVRLCTILGLVCLVRGAQCVIPLPPPCDVPISGARHCICPMCVGPW